MRIEKVNGLYRKPRLTAISRVPLLVWLPLLLVLAATLVWLSLRTAMIEDGSLPMNDLARKHSWRVVAVGDIACGPDDINFNSGDGIVGACQQKAVGKAIEDEHADAVLLLGDIQYVTGKFEDFEKSFVPYFRDIKVPIYVAAGNHDYGQRTVPTGDLSGYKKAFDQYFPGATYQKDGKTYYDFNIGPWMFYALDSNCEYIGGCDENSDQLNWLSAKLSDDSSVCSIGFWHHPLFTSGVHKDEESTSRGMPFWDVLQPSGVDIVLNGHDHHYERFASKLSDGTVSKNGIRVFISGAGGYSLRKVSAPFPSGQEKVIDDQFGYLYLELFPDRYEWQFKNTSGDVLDSGSDECS